MFSRVSLKIKAPIKVFFYANGMFSVEYTRLQLKTRLRRLDFEEGLTSLKTLDPDWFSYELI